MPSSDVHCAVMSRAAPRATTARSNVFGQTHSSLPSMASAEFDAMRRAQDRSTRSNAIALPSAGGAQRISFWQGDLLKPPSQKAPEPRFWQFHALEAIMDVDILALATILDMLDAAKLQGGFKISRVPPEATLYVLGNETFSSSVEGTSGLLGSDFAFEKRKLRARIGRWLEMIGAQEGDTFGCFTLPCA